MPPPTESSTFGPPGLSALARAGIAAWSWQAGIDLFEWDDTLHSLMGIQLPARSGGLGDFCGTILLEDRGWFQDLIKGATLAQGDFHCSVRVRHSDAKLHHLVIVGVYQGGSMRGIVQSLDQMQDLKQKETALRGMVDAALSDASIGMWTWEPELNSVTWDTTMHRIFDVAIGQFDGTIESVINRIHPEDAESFRQHLDSLRTMGPGSTCEFECRLVHGPSEAAPECPPLCPLLVGGAPACNFACSIPDSSIHWARFFGRTIENPYGVGVFLFGTAQLTDADRQREAELLRSNTELEQFAYIVSHDLQEPLRNISHNSQKLIGSIEGEMSDKQRRFMEHINNGSARMLSMIQGLVEYSRVGSKGDPFAWFSLRTALMTAQEDLAVLLQATEATVDLSKVTDMLICGDKGQIIRLFMNLFQNAIKYSKPNEPAHIVVTLRRAEGRFFIRIKDNGIGIAPKHWQRIFTPFKQLSVDSRSAGVGIGLTICRRIAQRHGGSLQVDTSIEGEGTTFLVILPENHAECEEES